MFQSHDKRMEICLPGCLLHVLIGCRRISIPDIFTDRTVKNIHFLLNDSDGAAQGGKGKIPHINSVDGDAACSHVIKSGEQHTDGCLSDT